MFSFHHVGYVVTDLSLSVNGFEKLGYVASKTYLDKVQDIKIVVMRNNNDPMIELILPIGDNNPINRFFGKNKSPTPYHVGYSVADISNASDHLRSQGFIATMQASLSVAFDNKPFIFFYSQPTGLIELIEI